MPNLAGEIIDTRMLIERQVEIEEEIDTLARDLAVNDAQMWDNLPESAQQRYIELAKDEEPLLVQELDEIQDIENAAIPDYPYGETLVREDYFTTYAQELAQDIGALADEDAWPLSYIDWDAAADALKVDYIEVEYQGNTYLARA